jgi:hypothetical protein
MKTGDLIKYPYRGRTPCFAIVLHLNDAGGTTKAHILEDGEVCWLVTSDCEVINESR